MTPNPFSGLLHSRKFWLLILDTVISLLLHYFGGEDTTFLIATIQPVFVMVIVSIFAEDNAERKLQGEVATAEATKSVESIKASGGQ